ncbi:MAG: branched-chain amino acid aminotransferase [Hyphomicrobiales bacterium]|nr:branched-chain amino acid aminotransferase [Hyphomicrobiales bacterium]
MKPNRNIWTWFEGDWHEGNHLVLGAADHGTWLGTMVFDGARFFDGVSPDLDLHCARVNASAAAMKLKPTMQTGMIFELAKEGIRKFDGNNPLYIRPMYWSTEGGPTAVDAIPESTAFCLCIEEAAMAPEGVGFSVTTTSFCRPLLSMAVIDAKASCLYPNNARMLREAAEKGFQNAISCDALGNVAETATANIFMAKDGEVFTPVPNGSFLNGITRQRVIKLLRDAGETVHEITLKIEDFRQADEIFSTGNYSKVTHVTAFDERQFELGPFAKKARELYWDWAQR